MDTAFVPSHVLFIDDDAAVGSAVAAALKQHGFKVTCATSAAAALGTLEQGTVDVVVSDLNMPSMNGLELCRRAHAIRPDLPVIIVTAFGSLETAVGAIRAGAYDF